MPAISSRAEGPTSKATPASMEPARLVKRPSVRARTRASASMGAPWSGPSLPPRRTRRLRPTPAAMACCTVSASLSMPKQQVPGAGAASISARSRWVPSPGAPPPGLSALSLRTTVPSGRASARATPSAGASSGGRKSSRRRQIHSASSSALRCASAASPSVVQTTAAPAVGTSAWAKPWNQAQSSTPGRRAMSAHRALARAGAKPGSVLVSASSRGRRRSAVTGRTSPRRRRSSSSTASCARMP